jgi:hypothetical protein
MILLTLCRFRPRAEALGYQAAANPKNNYGEMIIKLAPADPTEGL